MYNSIQFVFVNIHVLNNISKDEFYFAYAIRFWLRDYLLGLQTGLRFCDPNVDSEIIELA